MEPIRWPYFDPEYETLSQRINPPRVVVDNQSCEFSTLIKVDSANKHGILLEVVQVLTDLDLTISKAYICSDGGWFMDVFHVTDQLGHKLTDKGLIEFLQQEYYIRHMDGCTLDTDDEKVRVIKCLEAAIERRVSQGIRLELCTSDRVGLLSDTTRIFREKGLSVARADVSTQGDKAVNTFYVTDASGGPVDMKTIEGIRNEIGQQILRVKDVPKFGRTYTADASGKSGFSFGDLIKSQWERFSSNLGLIRSCS